MIRVLSVACLCLLAGCATDTQQGRARMVASNEIGAAYSQIEVETRLAFTPDVNCPLQGCASVEQFAARVKQLGERVGDAAYQLAFELDIQRPLSLHVFVPGKDDIGTLSSATGSIVIFDGLRELNLSDAALAFLIAREMGHVIAQHHEENSATSLGISIAVAVLFPVANVLRGVEAVYATTTAAGLASTAVSMAGSRIVRSLYENDQQQEADALALRILAYAGWQPQEVAAGLEETRPQLSREGWMADLLESKTWIDGMVMGPFLPPPLYPSLRLVALDDAGVALVMSDAEPPVVEVMAAELFAVPSDSPNADLLQPHGGFRLPWGEEAVCRSIFPAGVALPGNLRPVHVLAVHEQPVPSTVRASQKCVKKGKRVICTKPAAAKKKKKGKPAVKRVVRRGPAKRR